ncbi:MAG: MmgE/PrpD family protein [Polyangiales bacterium]
MSTIESLCEWASSLRIDDVPPRVLAACRDQRRSVMASIAASVHDATSRRVLAAIAGWAVDGAVVLPGTDRRVRAEDALYAATTLSMAQDFDDYFCFGHSGHSAVLVPILLAAETGATSEEQLVAQVVANEIEARLGASCVLGPLNGQMWSFIHAAGTAVAAGLLLGLTRRGLAHALAIALYQAPRPTAPGFMGPDTKLLTAAEPTLMGLRAARLAAEGATGPLDALDHPHGFLGAFSYAPLRAFFDGLGDGWATETLAVKPYPGCAYIDTTIDALLSLDLPAPDAIESIEVDASVLTCMMNAMSHCEGIPSTVGVNFSIPWSVAAAIERRRLGPDELRADRLPSLSALAARVRLRHDWSMTATSLRAFAGLGVPGFRGTSARTILSALGRMRSDHPPLSLELAMVPSLSSLVPDLRKAAHLPAWSPAAIADFSFTFPARVRVRTRDGRTHEARADVPRGAGATREQVSREKLSAYGPRWWGEKGTGALAAAIDGDAADLARFMAAGAETRPKSAAATDAA